jgi:hypothetical protein
MVSSSAATVGQQDNAGRHFGSTGLDAHSVLALGYLAIPNFIFVFGWFKLPYAVLLAALASFMLSRVFFDSSVRWKCHSSIAVLALLLAASMGWSALGGGSHFVYANPEWDVRDAVLGDLVRHQWPVAYHFTETGDWILRSAFGYFLAPALLGKLFGTAIVPLAVFVWTAVGVYLFLALLPLSQRFGWRLGLGIVIVVFFSGMDFVGQFIATESWPDFPARMEWWVSLSYPSLTNQLFWAPNHCVPLWIGTALVIRHIDNDRLALLALVMIPLTLIWTPFAALGLLPLVLLGIIRHARAKHDVHWSWAGAICALTFSYPILVFLTVDISGIPVGSVAAAAAPGQSTARHEISLHSYALFVACEFALLGLVLAPNVRRDRESFWLALIVLLALPLFRFGPNNDSLLRLSTPYLIVLLTEFLYTLFDDRNPRSRALRWIAMGFIVIGAHTAVNEFWRAATFRHRGPNYDVELTALQDGRPAAHYMGRLSASQTLSRMLKSSPSDNP